MTVDTGNLVANILSLIGLCLLFLPVPPALPILFLIASFTLRIGMVAYQDLAK